MYDQGAGPVAFDFEKLSPTTPAIGFTASKYEPTNDLAAQRVIFTVETAGIRYRIDGGTPTASDGMLAAAGSTVVIDQIANIKNFKMIAASGSPVVNVTYLK